MRLAKLENDGGTVAVGRGLLEGAGEQGGRSGCLAQTKRVVGGISQQRHRPRVPGGLGMHDLRCDLAGRRSSLAQDRRRRVVETLALGWRKVLVDRRAEDRVSEANSATGFDDAGGDQLRHRGPHFGVGESGEPGGVANLRAIAEHTERASELGRRGPQSGQPEQHCVGDAPRDERANIAGRGRARAETVGRRLLEHLTDEERIAARDLGSCPDKPIIGFPWQRNGDHGLDCLPRQGRQRKQLRDGIGN